ncbi:MAG TPA: hypothetical protein EYQ60_16445 [Myxococcales bacterium]|nr:hypothetical protein [Myxococcales bacterium]HIK86578.1 hypothetical protein [Myxococcales bacterium]
MPKLWIIHRSPQQRAALARLSGLAQTNILAAEPNDARLVHAAAPEAVVLGLVGDFELELDFAHRQRAQLSQTRWLLIAKAADADEAQRLFHSLRPDIQKGAPSARTLRAFISAATSQRHAASLTERQRRQRVGERFSLWLGGLEVPGLLRALDPSLANLPLLVRGVPGSGRSLLCHYVETFRDHQVRGRVLRLSGRELGSSDEIALRISEAERSMGEPLRRVWIDEIDALPAAEQRAVAELIAHGSAGIELDVSGFRWITTAGPSGLEDRLESSLEHAFAPLEIEIPSLLDHPETLGVFASNVAREWTKSVGGVTRDFSDSALLTLEAHPWTGDRSELEAVLRTSLAASSREVLEDVDLHFPTDTLDTETSDATGMPGSFEETPIPARHEPDPNEPDAFDAIEEAIFANDEIAAEPAPDDSTLLSEASFNLAKEPTKEPESETTSGESDEGQGWRRLARSLSHEIRNPLVSIRTFAELLPKHFEDETFRERFAELVGRDVSHISDVVSRLTAVAEREKFEPEPVDVSALIEELLEQRRERIAKGRLLVLRELERDAPLAWADAQGLQVSLAGLLDHALEALPERGDLFVATRHLPRAADGRPKLRILLRHHNPTAGAASSGGFPELAPQSNILAYVLAETVVTASGGTLTIDASDAQETLILVDLQTPT